MRDASSRDIDPIFAINADALPGVSILTPTYFEQLMREHALFRLIEVGEQVAGYLCAMHCDATYEGEEFQWFRKRLHEDFLYIDQVAIGQCFRGRGLGRALYDDLERYARRNGIGHLACEVNHDPINVESQAFHRRYGFSELGRMETRGRVVSLLAKRDLC